MNFFEAVIAFSVRQKFLVALMVAVLIAVGLYNVQHLPLDAVPDITNNQVQVVTVSPTLAPQEVEQLITYPVEVVMSNIEGVTEIRSISRYGLSVVTIVFEDGKPMLDMRQLVREQIDIARGNIPDGLGSPELMPITTGLGEIYQYTLAVKPGYEDQYDAMDLRTIQDWIVKRQLNGIKGIVEVSSFGGYLKQYEVAVDPMKLNSFGLTLHDVFTALEQNNQNSGGSYIEKGPKAYYIRTEGLVKSFEDIENIVIASANGIPILIRQIGEVRLGSAQRYGAITRDGKGETVGGITLMLKGANSSEAIAAVHERVKEVKKSLPEGVTLEPYLDRSDLIDRAIHTVSKNLLEGGLIVIFVLVLMLGNFRAGLIVASVIPLSMLFAVIMMRIFDVSANLMSLGAIDFGIVVDGAVIIVEGVLHLLYTNHIGKQLKQKEMDDIIIKSTASIYRSAAFGVLIILVVFIPIMTLQGIEGKMFRPMAQTVSFAVLGALLLSLTYVPMMTALTLKKHIKEHHTFADKFVGWLRNRYLPILKAALHRPVAILVSAVVLLVLSVIGFMSMGGEFIPTLEEGDLAMQMTIQPGSALTESVATSTKAEQILLENFPEVLHVVSKIGTAEVPTDPMAIEDADIMIVLKPKGEWTTTDNREELVEMMKEKLSVLPGVAFEFTQPIQLRFNELMTGSKTDIAVKIYGEDMTELAILANKAAGIIEGIDGAGDVKVEATEGLPQLMINYNRSRMAYYGVSVMEMNELIKTAYAGSIAGSVFEGERKFDLVVRLAAQNRNAVDLNSLMLTTALGVKIPLAELATVELVEGPMLISRDNARRRISIGINVRNRDIASLVADIESQLNKGVKLPPGYSITYGGQFENLEHAKARLMIAVPVALFLILLLLYAAFSSFKYALLIFTAVPLSAIGGIAALMLRGMPFSISAGVGFIALFGVAVLNGIVLISYFNQLKKEGGMDLFSIITTGAQTRLRPVLMTAMVAALGFMPMALSSSAGAEVQKPLATVVIGGLVSATLLTLLVLPVLYLVIERREKGKKGTMNVVPIIGLLLLLSGGLQAQTPLTLDDALNMARTQNPEAVNAGLQVDYATKGVKNSFILPPMQATMQYGQFNTNKWDLYWDVDQSIGSVATHVQQKKANQVMLSQAENQQEVTMKQLDYQVGLAWHSWVYQYQLLQLHTEDLRIVTELVGKAKLQYQVGETSLLEQTLAQSNATTARNNFTRAQQQYRHAMMTLQNLLQTTDSLVPPLSTYAASTLPLEAGGMALNPMFPKGMELQAELSMKMAKLEMAKFFPELSVGYFNQQTDGIRGFQGVKAGLSLPIWGFNNSIKKQQHLINSEIYSNLATSTGLSYQNEIDNLMANLKVLYVQLQTDGQQLLDQADMMQSTAELAYRNGEIDFFRLAQSRQASLQLRMAYLEQVFQLNQQVLKLQLLSL